MLVEEVDVYEVHLLDRTTNEVLQTFDAGTNYDLAVRTKDDWDIQYSDGTMYTKIEIYAEDVED